MRFLRRHFIAVILFGIFVITMSLWKRSSRRYESFISPAPFGYCELTSGNSQFTIRLSRSATPGKKYSTHDLRRGRMKFHPRKPLIVKRQSDFTVVSPYYCGAILWLVLSLFVLGAEIVRDRKIRKTACQHDDACS